MGPIAGAGSASKAVTSVAKAYLGQCWPFSASAECRPCLGQQEPACDRTSRLGGMGGAKLSRLRAGAAVRISVGGSLLTENRRPRREIVIGAKPRPPVRQNEPSRRLDRVCDGLHPTESIGDGAAAFPTQWIGISARTVGCCARRRISAPRGSWILWLAYVLYCVGQGDRTNGRLRLAGLVRARLAVSEALGGWLKADVNGILAVWPGDDRFGVFAVASLLISSLRL